MQWNTVQSSVVQYSAVQYSTAQYNTVQYSSVLISPTNLLLLAPSPTYLTHSAATVSPLEVSYQKETRRWCYRPFDNFKNKIDLDWENVL